MPDGSWEGGWDGEEVGEYDSCPDIKAGLSKSLSDVPVVLLPPDPLRILILSLPPRLL